MEERPGDALLRFGMTKACLSTKGFENLEGVWNLCKVVKTVTFGSEWKYRFMAQRAQ